MTFTKSFWIQSFERAIKTAAQSVLLVWTGDQVVPGELEWSLLELSGSAALFGAVVSLLTSIVSTQVGDVASPSLVPTPQPAPEPAG